MSSSLRLGTRIVSKHVQSSVGSVCKSGRAVTVTTGRGSDCRFGSNNNNNNNYEKRVFSTAASATHEQSVNLFPSIVIGANTLSPQGSFAEAQAHVSNKVGGDKCDASRHDMT